MLRYYDISGKSYGRSGKRRTLINKNLCWHVAQNRFFKKNQFNKIPPANWGYSLTVKVKDKNEVYNFRVNGEGMDKLYKQIVEEEDQEEELKLDQDIIQTIIGYVCDVFKKVWVAVEADDLDDSATGLCLYIYYKLALIY